MRGAAFDWLLWKEHLHEREQSRFPLLSWEWALIHPCPPEAKIRCVTYVVPNDLDDGFSVRVGSGRVANPKKRRPYAPVKQMNQCCSCFQTAHATQAPRLLSGAL